MKKRIIPIAVFAVIICMTFSSCTVNRLIPTVDSLMTPPLYYSEYKELVNTFSTTVGENAVLCSPKEGKYTSAITITDLNGDGFDDGLILYKIALEDNTVHFAVFRGNEEGDTWTRCGDPCEGLGNEVSSLVITDFDSDGIMEIVTAWNYSGTGGDNAYSVYKSADDGMVYTELMNSNCTIARVVDIDNDGTDEIFCVSGGVEKGSNTKTAQLLRFSRASGTFEVDSETPVDPLAGYYASFKTEGGENGGPIKIFLDGVKSNNQMITEVVRLNTATGELEAPFYDEETGTNIKTLRFEQIQCADIDSDGKIEIPVQEIYLKPEEKEGIPVYLTNWTSFSGNKATVKKKTILNISEGFMIDLDGLKSDKLTVSRQSSTISGSFIKSWSIYDGVKKPSNALFTIVFFNREKWDYISGKDEGYIVITERADGVICARLNQKGKLQKLDITGVVTKIPQ